MLLRRFRRHSLLELYYHRLGAVDPQQIDFVTTMAALAGIRKLLKKRHPPEVLVEHGKLRDPPSVSIIIPVFRNHADLLSLLDRLNETAGPVFEVIVINDCPDEPLSQRVVESAYGFPVSFLANPWNAGFAPANNLATRYAQGENLLFLNSDTVPRSQDWLANMLSTLDADPGLGIVGAKTLFSGSNRIEHFGLYPVYVAETDSWHNAHYFQGIEDEAFAETLVDQDTDMVTGAALMIPRRLFEELGGFDETYAIGGYEDRLVPSCPPCRLRHPRVGRRGVGAPEVRIARCVGALFRTDRSMQLALLQPRLGEDAPPHGSGEDTRSAFSPPPRTTTGAVRRSRSPSGADRWNRGIQ